MPQLLKREAVTPSGGRWGRSCSVGVELRPEEGLALSPLSYWIYQESELKGLPQDLYSNPGPILQMRKQRPPKR